MREADPQPALFELPPHEVEAAPRDPELDRLAAAVPAAIRLGTTSWAFLGWRGIVYGERVSQEAMTRHGLGAYAKHPLLRAVEIDRSFYEPLEAHVFAGFARQVPEDFRFIVKAHEQCTVAKFPTHPRYGRQRGEPNPIHLDAAYAEDRIVGPTAEGLGERLGALLFQFPPQDREHPRAFADELHRFLSRLPKGVRYAVELRNAELLAPEYGAALADVGAIHCHNAWTAMPDVLAQARAIPPRARSPLLVRWLVRRGDGYEEAQARARPFNRVVAEDEETCGAIAHLVTKADLHGVPSLVVASNNAEGCAPKSLVRLARSIGAKATRATG